MSFDLFNYENLSKSFTELSNRKNTPGVDSQSIGEFAVMLDKNLQKIEFEIKEGMYKPIPVKMIDEDRKISIMSIRDKIVQNILKNYLSDIIQIKTIPNNFGYIRDRSIFKAADAIYEYINSKKPNTLCKCDIHSFFSSIDHDILLKKVEDLIDNHKIVQLISGFVRGSYLNQDGKIVQMSKGLILGCSISPALSNIYLLNVDEWLYKNLDFYVRFSDDMLLRDVTENHEMTIQKVSKILEEEKLFLNFEKSRQVDLKTGFRYLGHYFKSDIPKIDSNLDISAKKKENNLTFLIRDEKIEILIEELCNFNHVEETDIKTAINLAIEKEDGLKYLILLVIIAKISECFFSNEEILDIKKNLIPISFEELQLIAVSFSQDKERLLDRLIGYLIDCGSYHVAMSLNVQQEDECKESLPKQDELNRYIDLFKGRPDMYARGYVDAYGKRQYYKININLSGLELGKMLQDRLSLGIYPLNEDNNSKFVVLDIDLQKKFILNTGDDSKAFLSALEKARITAISIKEWLAKYNIHSYVEFSGYKGYHIWIFFNRWTNICEFKDLKQMVIDMELIPSGISLEIIPQMSFEEDELIKLPLAYHEITRNQAVFLNDDGVKEMDQMHFVSMIRQNDPSQLSKMIQPKESNYFDSNTTISAACESETKRNDISQFPQHIIEVYNKCALMKYMVDKSQNENFLGHFERNALLYVFGHIEDGGRDFIHYVISNCINYSFEVTEGFIARIKEKPVSCQKLKMRFSDACLKLSCNCNFDEYPVFYPSPVIYGYMLEPQKVTKPDLIDSGTRITEIMKVQDTLRINKLVSKVMDLAKERKSIEREMLLCQEELEAHFALKKASELDVTAGKLIKKGKDWYLKLDICLDRTDGVVKNEDGIHL